MSAILFLEDWLKYPSAVPHFTTKNTSWLHMAQAYHAMGIKNHLFLLALVNPLLEFVNPHDEFLTQEQKEMIVAECKINPWYFFREVARIPAQSGADAIPLEANRGNIALWWCFFNHITMILTQPRQTGKSYTLFELCVYLLDIKCQGTLVNLFTKDEKLRKESVDIIKRVFDVLPPYLDLRNKRTDASNTEEITVNLLENKMKTFVPRASEKDANNVGRGFGSAINWVDEAPFCGNAHISLPALFSAGNAVRDRAASAEAPYCNILTTTAGKLDTAEGKYVYEKYVRQAMTWSESVFDQKNAQELEKFVRTNAPGGGFQMSIILSHRQLGKTDEWLWKKMQESGSEGDAANRDYFNVWTSGTESHPLSPALLKRIVQSQNDAVYNQYFPHQKYVIRWNVAERNLASYMATNKTILAIDTSSAGGGDDIGQVWLDADTLDVAGAATVNETNLLVYSNWLCMHLVENKNVTLIMERKNSGEMIHDILMSMLPTFGEDPYKRIFNLVVQDKDEHKDRAEVLRIPLSRRTEDMYTLNKTAFGFNTAASGRFARSELYGNTLQNAAKRGGDKAYDKKLITQIAGLVKKGDRVDHASGKHDDMVFAWLMGHWFLMHGKHLAHYGINSVMSNVGDERPLTMEEYLAQQRQIELNDRIQDLSKQLEDTSDAYLMEKLEHQIRLAAQGLVYQQGAVTNIDQLLADIKERRKKRMSSSASRQYEEAVNDHDYYRNMMGFGNSYRR